MEGVLEDLDILSSWDVFSKTQQGEIPDGSPSDLAFYYRLAKCLDAKGFWSSRLDEFSYQQFKQEISCFGSWMSFITWTPPDLVEKVVGPLHVPEKEPFHMKIRTMLFDVVFNYVSYSKTSPILDDKDFVDLLHQQEMNAPIANVSGIAHRSDSTCAKRSWAFDDMFYTLEHDAEDWSDFKKSGGQFIERVPYIQSAKKRQILADSMLTNDLLAPSNENDPLGFLAELGHSDPDHTMGYTGESIPPQDGLLNQQQIDPIRSEWPSYGHASSQMFAVFGDILADIRSHSLHYEIDNLEGMKQTMEKISIMEQKLHNAEYQDKESFSQDLQSLLFARSVEIVSMFPDFAEDTITLQEKYKAILDTLQPPVVSETFLMQGKVEAGNDFPDIAMFGNSESQVISAEQNSYMESLFGDKESTLPQEEVHHSQNEVNILSLQPNLQGNGESDQVTYHSDDDKFITYNDLQTMRWKQLTLDKRMKRMKSRMNRWQTGVVDSNIVSRNASEMVQYLEIKSVKENRPTQSTTNFYPEDDAIASTVPGVRNCIVAPPLLSRIPGFLEASFVPENMQLISMIKDNTRRPSDEKDGYAMGLENLKAVEPIFTPIDQFISRTVLARSIMTILMHSGFSGFQESVIDILVDVSSSMLDRLGRSIRSSIDLYNQEPTMDSVFHCMSEVGLGSLEDLKLYIYQHLIKFKSRLIESEKASRLRPYPSLPARGSDNDLSGREHGYDYSDVTDNGYMGVQNPFPRVKSDDYGEPSDFVAEEPSSSKQRPRSVENAPVADTTAPPKPKQRRKSESKSSKKGAPA
eukprot:TRINITY_DN1639_c0_g1_i5.p1 TRINITY_DN1639_c0_g1~~TRINITY_DN1639_c0_g1_i5.p1  ORF type:complete len:804 (+),score=142.62 TRINITY_DN1639_c0_g1_i5:47-2458(+)